MSNKKRLITNFLSLASMQGLNFILPLVTLPYLLQVVGPGKFGLISFAQALIQYFILFTDYGFNLVATKEISLNRENKEKLSVIFSTVMLVRSLLLVFSFLVMVVLILFIPKFQNDSQIYLLTFGMVVGNVLFPVWFFQGIEQMKVISILNIVSKLIFTLGIFVFVKNQADYLYVPVLNSLGYIAIGVIGIYLVIFRYRIKLIRPSLENIKYQLKEGWDIFVSNLVTSLYTTSNTFILGFFASNTVVGYYSSAEKVVKAISSVVGPLIQAVYPFLSKALHESKHAALNMINKIFLVITLVMGILSLFVGIFAKEIVDLALGKEYVSTIPLLQILAALPLILGWASVLGILTMINFDYKKELSRIYILAGILSIILMILLIPTYKEVGTAWNALITEAFATLLMAIFLWKKGIHVWKLKGIIKGFRKGISHDD
ncbi:polysaccharide biosynthesis protein [Neobacillus bataviensis LMG 21833]|uniref:Polysaccharide biosynthesis protein n=1 Tax=Neobacillus bataviensis LMG 21833 TaxID=1117379 RepID=K6DSW9_9BACI|nr:flippase [Neobacillus bataviensis]EKN71343.1 polysaccharide biosynthesis protein [Neobacillus bataviensis LMG 21833]